MSNGSHYQTYITSVRGPPKYSHVRKSRVSSNEFSKVYVNVKFSLVSLNIFKADNMILLKSLKTVLLVKFTTNSSLGISLSIKLVEANFTSHQKQML